MTRARLVLAAALGALALAAGCGGGAHVRTATVQGIAVGGAAGRPALGLPLDRAVAQLFAVGFAGRLPGGPGATRLARRDWGVVLLTSANVASRAQVRALVGAIARRAARAGHLAPLVAADPHALAFAALPPTPDLAADPGPAFARAGSAMSAAGVRLALGPTADIGYDAGPAADRAFSADPGVVTSDVAAAASALAGAGVAPAPEHFPGQGGASQDPGLGTATVGLDLPSLRRADLRPFAAVAATAPAVALSDAVYTAFDGVTPATLLPAAFRLLRRSLGFRGAALSGDLVAATAAAGGSVGAAAVAALRAGADVLVVPGDAANQDAAFGAVLHAVRSGRVPLVRVAEALERVEALKRAYGAVG